jgi:hypothetical protein
VKFIPGAGITYDDLLQKNPNAFKEYQRMIDESSRDARQHRGEVIAAIAKQYDASEKESGYSHGLVRTFGSAFQSRFCVLLTLSIHPC